MFNKIMTNKDLLRIMSSECFENDIGIKYDTSLLDKYNEVDEDKVLILCVDEYFSTKVFINPPPSIDCLVIVKCSDDNYALHLIELRNVSSIKGAKPKEIVKKFNTTIEIFLKKDFKNIFMDENFNVKDFKAYLVTDACKIKKKFPDLTEKDYRMKIKDSALGIYQSLPPFKFRDKYTSLIPCVPEHIIKAC